MMLIISFCSSPHAKWPTRDKESKILTLFYFHWQEQGLNCFLLAISLQKYVDLLSEDQNKKKHQQRLERGKVTD